MGTRSRIAIANADGTFTSIYCHWDGYPSHHGVILRDHYKDEAKVKELMALGDISVLGKEIGTKHNFDNHPDGECNAFKRDRGEEETDAMTSADFEALCADTQNCGGEYLYVFKGGGWYCAAGGIAFFGLPADKAPEFLEHIDEVLIKEAKDAA
jgi:hypothetical protein